MTRLAGAVTMAIVDQFGPDEVLRRLADPWWFQAFGCVLGFDWHSSGVTTVTCGALKEAYKLYGADLGIAVAGGKGATSRRAPDEIAAAADRFAVQAGDRLVYASRMSAKVDSAAVQDGFQLYHHVFLFTPAGQWCVIQQGLNGESKTARRYHWLGETVDDFVCEPHGAISDLAAPRRELRPNSERQLILLNMVAREATANREKSAALVGENPDWLLSQIERYTEGPTLFAPKHHRILPADVNSRHLRRILVSAHEQHPDSFRETAGDARSRSGDHSQPVPLGGNYLRRPGVTPRSGTRGPFRRRSNQPPNGRDGTEKRGPPLGRLLVCPRRQRRNSVSRRSGDV